MKTRVVDEVDEGRAGGGQRVIETGKQPLEDLPAPGDQLVSLKGLRHTRAMVGLCRQPVALDDRDVLEVVGKHARGDHAGHAAAHDHRVRSLAARHGSPGRGAHGFAAMFWLTRKRFAGSYLCFTRVSLS